MTVFADDYSQYVGSIDLRDDDEASVFCGGDLHMWENAESEGMMVVCGSLYNAYWSVAAKVMWGCLGEPDVRTPALLVGGNVVVADDQIAHVTSSAQIGGSIDGRLIVGTTDNAGEWAPNGLDGVHNEYRSYIYAYRRRENEHAWDYYSAELEQLQKQCTVTSGMGRAAALRCTNAQGVYRDYGTYLDDTVRPLSTRCRERTPTGTLSCGVSTLTRQSIYGEPLATGRCVTGNASGFSMVLEATGDGRSAIQVFNTSFDELDRMMASLGRCQFELDVRNCPDDSLIIFNVAGSGDRTWRYGFNAYLNGQDVSARPNYCMHDSRAFIRLCSRVLWNFYEITGKLTIDRGHVTLLSKGPAPYDTDDMVLDLDLGSDVYGAGVSAGNIMPGSIVVPYGSAYVKGSTNGHLLVAGDLVSQWWEHHNVTWLGLTRGSAALEKKATHPDWA